jgi:DNA-binding transcriptional regulator YiaG
MKGRSLRAGRIVQGIESADAIAQVLGISPERVRQWERLPDVSKPIQDRYFDALQRLLKARRTDVPI